jgi:acyl-CoA synthetase (AMP-forming)/AMP-acid ligase II
MRKTVASADVSTLIELLQFRTRGLPRQRAYTFLLDGENEEVHLTYEELERRARCVALHLRQFVAESDRVLLLFQPGLEFIIGFFGCLFAGAVAIPVNPPHHGRTGRSFEHLKVLSRNAQPGAVLTTSSLLPMVGDLSVQALELGALPWLAVENSVESSGQEWQPPRIEGQTLALIQYTAGSTADPKGVMVSHANLLDNSAIIHQRFGHDPRSKGVIWLPPYHDMGLVGGVLQPLYGGFPVTLMSPVAFLMRPIRWLQAISRTRATTSGGPNFAYDLCVRKISNEQRSGLDLSCWKVAFNGAEPVRPETLEQFNAAFAECGFRPDAFYPCYGLAEATLFVAGESANSAPRTYRVRPTALQHHRVVAATSEDEARELVSCGQPATNLEVTIVDPVRLTRCPPNHVGEIWVSGESVALGYWNRPEETETTFRAYIADSGEGPFLRTGDLGFFLDGQLVIAGRLKDLIILGGRNHYPQDIELTVEQAHSALRPGACAAFSVDRGGAERLIVLAEVEPRYRNLNRNNGTAVKTDEIVQAIRQAVAEHHGIHADEVQLLGPGTIPKTTSGKIQRNACRSSYLKEKHDLSEHILDQERKLHEYR